MDNKHTYRVDLNWDEGRKGFVKSPELNSIIQVATPPDFPKGIEGVWSPEHLFVAAVESCFMTTFLAVAENSKLEFSSLKAHAVGKVDKVEGHFRVTEIKLNAIIEISEISQKERATRILVMSEKACLISKSIKTKVNFEPQVIVK
jgi:peroxiredoxin-like protein